MIVSQARIDANRRNAQKSTGPRTEEGKARSRANALKHGLCASVCVPEDLALVQQRSREIFDTLKPQNELHVWLVDQVALSTVRIDRTERIERRARDKHSLRAELCWDDDRRLEVEILARDLGKNPAETVNLLLKTPHGCEWMMSRWAMLAHAADTQPTGWTDDQTRLAFDLLATPTAFREGRKPGLVLDFEGHVLESGENPAAVARREVAILKEKREAVAPLDEVERTLAANDLSNENNPELRRLRRYEATQFSRLKFFLKRIEIQSPYRLPDPSLRPEWVNSLDPEPELKPEAPHPDEVAAAGWDSTQFNPPFCLEPDEFPEPGQVVDLPKVLSGRREKRFRKAEARRQGERRKLDKLRA